MDLLDRLLGHDQWTTSELLRRCEELTVQQFHQEFDIGWRSAQRTFVHIISNVQVWSDLIAGRSEITDTAHWWGFGLEQLQAVHQTSYADFTTVARSIRDGGRWDSTFTDILDSPPRIKSCGGGVSHVITHNMHHRSELIHILTRLGLSEPPEGDLLGWEEQSDAVRKAITR